MSVAVKRLYGRQEVQTQFIKEANSMCSLDHPNIIKLYGIVLSEPLMLVRIYKYNYILPFYQYYECCKRAPANASRHVFAFAQKY